MIIWDFLTVKNSDNTAKIIADQGEIGSFKVTNTTTLQTINYASGTTPTAAFYTTTIDNYLQLNGGDHIYCANENLERATSGSDTFKMLKYMNCSLGPVARFTFSAGADTALKRWNLDLGMRWIYNTNPATDGNGNAQFLRMRCLNSQGEPFSDGVSLKLAHNDDPNGALEVRTWSDNTWAGVHCLWLETADYVKSYTFEAMSDRRLKTNIQPWQPHTSVLNLPIYSFDYIQNSSHHIGCLAQDLQQICPEIVHEDSNGYLQIEESKIVYLLLQEVKQLKQEVELLKNRYEY